MKKCDHTTLSAAGGSTGVHAPEEHDWKHALDFLNMWQVATGDLSTQHLSHPCFVLYSEMKETHTDAHFLGGVLRKEKRNT